MELIQELLMKYNKEIVSIITLVLIGLITGFLKSNAYKNSVTKFYNFINKLFKKNKTDDDKGSKYTISELDIDNHNLFNYIDYWLYNHIPSMVLKTEYRTIVFRKYLHFYFKSYKEMIQSFLRDKDYKKMGHQQLKKELLSMMTKLTIKMEDDMLQFGIPDVVVIKMKNKLNHQVELTRDLLESIIDSSFYNSDNNLLKVYSFLNIIHSILDNTASNIEPVCNSLNGELSGLSMGGFTEPASKHKKE